MPPSRPHPKKSPGARPCTASSANSSLRLPDRSPRRRAVRPPARGGPMTDSSPSPMLSIIVCGAGPATAIGTPINQASERGWTVSGHRHRHLPPPWTSSTPSPSRLRQAARSVVSTASQANPGPRRPMRSSWPPPLTTPDTYALGVLAETTGLGVPYRGPPLRQFRPGQPSPISAQRRCPPRRRCPHPHRPRRRRAAPAAHRRNTDRQLAVAPRLGRSRTPDGTPTHSQC